MCKQAPVGEPHGARRHVLLSASVCVVLILICLSATTAQAQVLYGSLTGNVTDSSGAVIPGANVGALNVRTGVVRDATTDSNGVYRFSALQPGTYKVTISAPKFASSITENVEVIVNNIKRVDAQLKVASQAQDVTVTAEAPLLQTDKADVHTDLSSQQIENIPITSSQGRNFQSLLRLIPGVGQTQEDNSAAGNPQRAINANVNGQSRQTINTRIDGAQDAYPWLPANVAYVPPADAIETVNVVTNSFDPEQGMAGAAAVNVQIKSGTNNFHGSVHEFHTDQSLKARNYFQTDLTRFPKKNRNNQNQFGGTLGGPIINDRLFFFADYERTTQRNLAGPRTITLPTAQMRNGDFTFTGAPIIYDPLTGDATGANKQQVSCNGVLNMICPNRIDPAAKYYLDHLPAVVNDTANHQNNYNASGTGLFNRDNIDVKINYVPSRKSTLFSRYSLSRSHIFDPPTLGLIGGDATGGGQLGNADSRIQSVGIGGTYMLFSNLLADWNLGFTRQRLGAQNIDLDQAYGLDVLHIPGTNGAGVPGDPTLYNGFPAMQISSVSNLGNPNTGNPFLFRDNQYVWGANLSWTRGKHGFRFGAEYNHTQLNHFQPQGGATQTARGTFVFNGNVTSSRGVNVPQNPFNSWADFLLGLPSLSGKATANQNPTALRWSQWAWYVRDQWQFTPRLTLTLGVRWEFYPFAYSDHGRGVRYFNPKDGNVYIGGVNGVPRNDGVDVGSGQFLPRIGFAYRLTEKTVVRGGYGMSADPNNFRYFRNSYPSTTNVTNQPANTANFIAAASLTGTNAIGLGSGTYSVPTGIVLLPTPDISSGVISLPSSTGTTTIANPFRRGYINSFNLMVQQEWAGFVLETGYAGARAIRPLTNMNINAGPIGGGSAQGLLSVALGRNITGNINAETPFKNNYYDSLQTKVTRRLKGTSQIGLIHTWSKAINYSDNEELNFLLFPYPAYWEKNRGLASFDRTSNLQIFAVYELPFGKGQKWLQSGIGNWLAGGWQLNTVVSKLSGIPFTVTGSGSTLNANGSTQTADLAGAFHALNGTPPRTGVTCALTDTSCHYFDASAFGQPTSGRFGNTGRDQFRGPGYFNMDLSLFRNFKLTERFAFQFRAEAFGFTNTPHFNNPNTTCGSSAGQLCSAATSNNNFGVITQTLGASPGDRTVWLAAKLIF